MYIATQTIHGKIHYFLRQSYLKNGLWLSRELFSLGSRPGKYIVYGGGNSFYLRDELLSRVGEFTNYNSENDLEFLLWPFIDPEIRYKLSPFYKPERRFRIRGITAAELTAIRQEIHDFDRRRLHYLRYGSINQGALDKMRPKMLRVMLEKSRDEREQYFLRQEESLEPDEIKRYIYTIFDLQRYFTELIACSMPEGLDQKRLDKYFLTDICALNLDRSFWAGMADFSGLHQYLQRYLIMFFDYDFAYGLFSRETLRGFINQRARHHSAAEMSPVGLEQAGAIFAVSLSELQQMSRSRLTRLYRKKAMELHPDKGGDHNSFVNLTAAFKELLKNKL